MGNCLKSKGLAEQDGQNGAGTERRESHGMISEILAPDLVAKLKPKLEPFLVGYGLRWADALPVVQTFTDEELQAAIRDPGGFDWKGLLLHAEMIAKLKPKLEPALMAKNLRWEDVRKDVEGSSTEELQAAMANPEGWLADLRRPKQSAAFVPPESERRRPSAFNGEIPRKSSKEGHTTYNAGPTKEVAHRPIILTTDEDSQEWMKTVASPEKTNRALPPPRGYDEYAHETEPVSPVSPMAGSMQSVQFRAPGAPVSPVGTGQQPWDKNMANGGGSTRV